MSAQLWHGKVIATVSYTSTQLGAQQSPSFTNLLTQLLMCLDLANLSHGFPIRSLVHSTKIQLSFSHHVCLTLLDQATNTNFDRDAPAMRHPIHVQLVVRTALALQHLAHVCLIVWASNHIKQPWLIQCTVNNRDIDLPTSTDIRYSQRLSSCTFMTRPTSATCNNHLAAPI